MSDEKKMSVPNPDAWRVCKKSTAYSIHSRRCFVTGEYCSKQTNVHKERRKLHNAKEKSINAFVVMNFSEMSDVVYKWRLQTFIESLKKYLWLNTQTNEIACIGTEMKKEEAVRLLWKQELESPLKEFLKTLSMEVSTMRAQREKEISDETVLGIKNQKQFKEAMAAVGQKCYADDPAMQEKLKGKNGRKLLNELNDAKKMSADDLLSELYGLLHAESEKQNIYEQRHAQISEEELQSILQKVCDDANRDGYNDSDVLKALSGELRERIIHDEIGNKVRESLKAQRVSLLRELLQELSGSMVLEIMEELKAKAVASLCGKFETDSIDKKWEELDKTINGAIGELQEKKRRVEKAEDQPDTAIKEFLKRLAGSGDDAGQALLRELAEQADSTEKWETLTRKIDEIISRQQEEKRASVDPKERMDQAIKEFLQILPQTGAAVEAEILGAVIGKKALQLQTQLTEQSAREILGELSENTMAQIPEMLSDRLLYRIQDKAIRKVVGEWVRVEKINVLRSDSNPASNYVICNRICQQLQIADLVIVDVSAVNTNVFYEFGLAVAFGKLILPICYSESFYAENKEVAEWRKTQKKSAWDKFRNHIGRHPWRKKLFEYYGIRYRQEGSHKQYVDFDVIAAKDSPFDDRQYGQFPYRDNRGNDEIGRLLYGRLRMSYNGSRYVENSQRHYNTVVVYTMDGFVNEQEAGQCIVNYYNNIVRQLRLERCFCGDRVGILGQSNSISDDHKDAQLRGDLMYNVSDIIRIGMNQATYQAQQKKIKTDDYMLHLDQTGRQKPDDYESISRFTKAHIENRCIPVYPDNPIYVEQYKNGIQKGILEDAELDKKSNFEYRHYFCLFHVMLYTLKYTNEIVVDISRNSLQALFWLGVAHGSDVHAISVRHIPTQKDLSRMEDSGLNERNIFDVAGLWTAILESNNMESFYQQLALAQLGIEQRAKLMLEKMKYYEDGTSGQLYQPSPFRKRDVPDVPNPRLEAIRQLLQEKNREESLLLESYYRDRFWRHMLRYNHLNIYIPPNQLVMDDVGEPKLTVAKWDVDAMDKLSHYLSKRKVIGQFHQEMSADNLYSAGTAAENFIAIGGELENASRHASTESDKKKIRSLPEYIYDCMAPIDPDMDKDKGYNILRKLETWESQIPCQVNPNKKLEYRGFTCLLGDADSDVYARFPRNRCNTCMKKKAQQTNCSNKVYLAAKGKTDDEKNSECMIQRIGSPIYYQTAQLLLWRDRDDHPENDVKFRVSLVGVSGPATLALTSLLIDEEQKAVVLSGDPARPNPPLRLPLNSLQRRIRKIFLDRFDATMEEIMPGDYIGEKAMARYAAKMYLTTMLYQYFLPFLSKADENRIRNGLHAYVTAPGSNAAKFNVAPRGYTQTYGEAVEEALKRVVESFRGVEALYRVKVKIHGKDSDTRRVLDIESVEQKSENIKGVSCLFAEKLTGSGEKKQ